MFAVPLINYHALKRRITYLFSRQQKDAGNRDVVFTADSKCAECSEKLILPHHMGCGHIFCFYCIKVRNYVIYLYNCMCERTLSLQSALYCVWVCARARASVRVCVRACVS